ncbi:hypothetical protein KC19_VG009500 [Ceratodon purpureus]|uniref:Uncharacterized protein n=1 Tax=Ceratodon purpureus TaxID=3225 RepID=A0A8T0HKR3_CERPU|nr:hypothetical protein KC19_VG009500 [Ceratodon purpureus]
MNTLLIGPLDVNNTLQNLNVSKEGRHFIVFRFELSIQQTAEPPDRVDTQRNSMPTASPAYTHACSRANTRIIRYTSIHSPELNSHSRIADLPPDAAKPTHNAWQPTGQRRSHTSIHPGRQRALQARPKELFTSERTQRPLQPTRRVQCHPKPSQATTHAPAPRLPPNGHQTGR